MAKGMLVSIYRNVEHGDCTNGGISSRVTSAVITGMGMPEIFEPSDRSPELVLHQQPSGHLYLQPTDRPGKWHMFGGNFAWCTDSRIRELVRKLSGGTHDGPIGIHDRVE